ncbi:MAG: ATP-binding protein [Spirochaetales bacterium]|nr:ATP-binding protein [Spirochaetales bacterium]
MLKFFLYKRIFSIIILYVRIQEKILKLVSRPKYLEKIKVFINKPVVKVLTGVRRCGKSSLLQLIKNQLLYSGIDEKQFIWINKESLEFDSIKNYRDLHQFITARITVSQGVTYIFIDEVQEIEEWERAVSSILADGETDIFITGSNARLLSSELATLLSGRYVEIPVYPLTFSEYVTFRETIGNRKQSPVEFQDFLKFGGFPGIHVFPLEEDIVFQYLNSLISTILFKDVVSRHAIREPAQLEQIVRFLFDNCGNITSAKRISEYLKNQKINISVDRVQNYFAYLEQAFLSYPVRRYDLKGLRHLEYHEKYYSGDIGLRHGMIGYKDNDISGVLENVVFLELLSRGYRISVGKWGQKEIDFVAEKQNERLYIQVCYLLSGPETINREFSALESLPDNYPKYVLSMDTILPGERSGIKRLNIIDWLLGKQ